MKMGAASHGLPSVAAPRRLRGVDEVARAGARHGCGKAVRRCAALCALAVASAETQSNAAESGSDACVEDGRPLEYGFYSDFRPVSYSANADAGSPGFNEHLGYEADLLTALETMADAGLAFNRKGIDTWPDIWLRPAGPDYDFVGGGITILDSRTRDAGGVAQVVFTSGHIAFRQSLLVRAEDAERYATHGDLADARVAVLGGTTGEHRLLALTGVVDAQGSLAAGTAIHLADGTVLTADGSADYRITAAGASANLGNRVRLEGPPGTVQEVLVLATDGEQLDALASGRVDAVARGELGNREASRDSASRFVVTALDPEVEYGGFAFDKDDRDLAECIDARISYLTDNRRIGYAEWLNDPQAFLERAHYWNATEAFAQIYAYSVLAELLRERFDGTWRDLAEVDDALSGDDRPIWLRVRHSGRRNENARAASRPFDGGRWRERRSELQIGAYRPLGGSASGLRAGISGHLLRVDADVRNGRSPAESHAIALGYGGAASLIWFGETGPYAATEARFSLWDADVQYVRRKLSTGVDGRSWGVSAETGWRFGVDGFRVTPHLRVAWTGVRFDRFTDRDGVAVTQARDGGAEAALGLQIGVLLPDSGLRVYSDIEFAHDFEEDSAINAHGYTFRSGLADSWAGLRAGVVKVFSQGVGVTLSGDFGTALDSDVQDAAMWGIRAGVRWPL